MTAVSCLPLIVIGSMNLTRTVDRGDFSCPHCHSLQDYRLRSRRPYLTVYLIPLVPLGNREQFVQCMHCRNRWDPLVLTKDLGSPGTPLDQDRFEEQWLRAAMLVVIDGGRMDESEIQGLQRIGSQLLRRAVDREELGQLCSSAYQNKITATHYIQSVSHLWSTQQKYTAMQACFAAASIGGELERSQMELLQTFKQQMDMTDEQFQKAVEAAIELE